MHSSVASVLALSALITVGSLPTPASAATLESEFDVGSAAGSVQVGKKGQGKHKYAIGHNRANSRVDVTVTEQGAGGNSTGSKFTYDAGKGLVQLSYGGKTVDIAISKKGVSVGATKCDTDDTQCISKAVYDAMPGLTPEEVAAALSAASTDLLALKNGDKVHDVMETLALMLASQQTNL